MLFWMIVVLLVLWLATNSLVEHGSTSPGTLLQLVAKGPQDLYLTSPSGYYPSLLYPDYPRLYPNYPRLYPRFYHPYNLYHRYWW